MGGAWGIQVWRLDAQHSLGLWADLGEVGLQASTRFSREDWWWDVAFSGMPRSSSMHYKVLWSHCLGLKPWGEGPCPLCFNIESIGVSWLLLIYGCNGGVNIALMCLRPSLFAAFEEWLNFKWFTTRQLPFLSVVFL